MDGWSAKTDLLNNINTGRLKMQDRKMRDWKMTDYNLTDQNNVRLCHAHTKHHSDFLM